jgi:hypothetical protein
MNGNGLHLLLDPELHAGQEMAVEGMHAARAQEADEMQSAPGLAQPGA